MSRENKHIILRIKSTAAFKKTALLICLLISLIYSSLFSQVINNAGAAVSIHDAVLSGNDIENNAAGTIDNRGSIDLTGSWTNSGTFNSDTGNIILDGNTVQTITRSGGETFYKFTVNNAGDSVKINNSLIIKDTANFAHGKVCSANDIIFDGPTDSGAGTIYAWGGTITYTNKAKIVIPGIYYDLTLDGATTKILKGDVTSTGSTFNLSSYLNTSDDTLFLKNPIITINRTSGSIIGNLKRSVNATSTAYNFPVGTNSGYNPLVINFSNLTSGDYLVRYEPNDIGNAGLPAVDDIEEVHDRFTNGYWKTQAFNSLASTKYSVTLTATGFGIDSSSRILKKEGGNLFFDGLNGSLSGSSDISRTNLNELSNVNTIFAIGKGRPRIIANPFNLAVCEGLNTSLSVNATGQGNLKYKWQVNSGTGFSDLINGSVYDNVNSPALNITGNPLTFDSYQYKCVIYDGSNNPNTSLTAILTVNHTPVITLARTSDTICNNTSLNINPSSDIPNSNFAWNVSNDAGIFGAVQDSDKKTINHQITNTNNYLAKAIYTIRPIAPTGCIGDNKTESVSVLPQLIGTPFSDTLYGGKNIKCYDENNGKIKLTISGGYKVLGDTNCVYTWTNPDNSKYITISRFRGNLTAGLYKVQIQDKFGCLSDTNVSLRQPNPLKASYHVVGKLDCNSSGAKLVADVPNGGTAPFKYSWLFGSQVKSSTDSLVNIGVGEYKLVVEDTLKCRDNAIADVIFPRLEVYVLDTSQYGNYNISCFNSNDGYIKLGVTGSGSNNYILFNLQGDTLKNATGTFNNLRPNTYYYLVENNLGCSSVQRAIDIRTSTKLAIADSVSQFYNNTYNISCASKNDGRIKIIPSGGHGKYSYNWSNLSCETGPVVENLNSGKYTVTLSDSAIWHLGIDSTLIKLCSISKDFILTKPPKLDIQLDAKNISCKGYTNGLIKTVTTGGVGNYRYTWTKDGLPYASSDDSIGNLTAGMYNLNVIDSLNCSTEASIMLSEPDSIRVYPTISNYRGFNLKCSGSNDGTINIDSIKGGVKDYTISWSLDNSYWTDASSYIKNLRAGKYSLIVTDDNNCSRNWTFDLKEPAKINGAVKTYEPTCKSLADGSAKINIGGGISPYSIQWSTNATKDSIANLTANSYNVVVTDENLCRDTVRFTIQEPDSLIVTLRIDSSVSCFGRSDAVIQAIPEGGTSPYNYSWNTGESGTRTIKHKSAGAYLVDINDSHNCHATNGIEVKEPLKLSVGISKTDVTCYGKSDGTATIEVTGGIKPFSYNWADGQYLNRAENLGSDSIAVLILDANKCAIDTFIKIHQPADRLSLRFTVNDPYCPDSKDGSIVAVAKGGTPGYIYSWSDGTHLSRVKNLDDGEVNVTVIDSNGCAFDTSAILRTRHDACLDIPNAFSPNGDGVNDTWNILAGDPKAPQKLSEMYPNASVRVYNRWGETIYQSEKGYTNEWNGTYKGRILPLDSYYYIIEPKKGSEKFSGIITIIR